jgi:hypothetical protein
MKYTNRLKARLAREKLAEAAKEGKNWIVTRKLILETEEGDMEFDSGDNVEIGATDDGDMAVKGQAAVVVISDEDIAKKVADIVVNADELSDVEFEDRSALDALGDGEDMDQVVDDLADAEPAEGEDAGAEGDIEVPMVKPDQKESVENKFAKFSENRMNPKKFYACESILVDEESDDALNMFAIKVPGVMKESFNDYAEFTKRVSELKGSIQPGKRELALTEAGEYMGSYDTEANAGELYPENSWKSADEMDNFESEPAGLMDGDLGYDEGAPMDDAAEDAEFGECFESVLKTYEESDKSGSDYMKLTESLEAMKLNENHIGEVVSSFNDSLMESCVRAYDTKYGKYVAAFKESVDCNNFIEEAKAEGRFTKRFFN